MHVLAHACRVRQHPAPCSNLISKRSKRKALDPQQPIPALQEQLEQVKSKIRAKVEHPFRVIKRQFGHVKVRYRGLAIRELAKNYTPEEIFVRIGAKDVDQVKRVLDGKTYARIA